MRGFNTVLVYDIVTCSQYPGWIKWAIGIGYFRQCQFHSLSAAIILMQHIHDKIFVSYVNDIIMSKLASFISCLLEYMCRNELLSGECDNKLLFTIAPTLLPLTAPQWRSLRRLKYLWLSVTKHHIFSRSGCILKSSAGIAFDLLNALKITQEKSLC